MKRQETIPTRDDSVENRSPWSELKSDPARILFVVLSSGLLCLSVVGVLLAMVGWFRAWTVAILLAALWPPTLKAGLRMIGPSGPSRVSVSSWLAVTISLSFILFTSVNSSEHLLTNRDPGVYVLTGRWLAEHGDLLYDSGLPDHLNVGAELAQQRLPQGVYAGEDGLAYFQFQHAPAVILASGHWLGGDWLLFRIMAVVGGTGLLGLYLLGRQLAGQTLGLVPQIAAAVHPAFLYVAKDAYSEMLALVFVVSGAMIWLSSDKPVPPTRALAVGLTLGASSLARIDAWLVGIGFLAGLAYLLTTDTSTTRIPRTGIVALLTGFLTTASLGLLDLLLRSPGYLADLSSSAIPMMVAFACIAVLTLALAFASRPTESAQNLIRRHIPRLSAGILAVGGLFGLLLRPHLLIVRADRPRGLIAGLQAREGVEVDAHRTYAEMSLEWFARYQGHIPVIFGILAIALVTYLILRRRGDSRTPVLLVLLALATVYVWRPSITPDHLWAMRRFVPVVLPLAFVFTALGARILLRRVGQSDLVRISLGAVLVLTIVNSVVTGWPTAALGTQEGLSNVTEDVCSALPENAAVLFDNPSRTIAGAVRTECQVPVSNSSEPDISSKLALAGFVPIRLSSMPTCETGVASISSDYTFPERTLTVPPTGPERRDIHLYLTRIEAEGAPFEIPEAAEAVLMVDLRTRWTPSSGSSLIAVLGRYREGMWLEYRPNGRVELWVTTDAGNQGIVVSPRIDDGNTRTVGGYVLKGTLYGFCGGQRVASREIPGIPTFANSEVALKPVAGEQNANMRFEGTVTVLEGNVQPSLTEGH